MPDLRLGQRMGLFDRLFKGNKDTPVIPPKGFVMTGPAEDAPEDDDGWDTEAVAEDIDGLVMAIEYVDPNGELSSRMITCRAISPEPPGYLRAYCHLRDSYRSFRIDRIREIREMESGEILHGGEILVFLAPYINFAIEKEKAVEQRNLQRQVGPAIRVLVYLAASDGHVHEAERRVIMNYVQAESRRLLPAQPFDAAATGRWIDHLKPTSAAAWNSVIRLADDAEHFPEFARTMIDLVNADGTINADEAAATREIIAAVRAVRGY